MEKKPKHTKKSEEPNFNDDSAISKLNYPGENI